MDNICVVVKRCAELFRYDRAEYRSDGAVCAGNLDFRFMSAFVLEVRRKLGDKHGFVYGFFKLKVKLRALLVVVALACALSENS